MTIHFDPFHNFYAKLFFATSLLYSKCAVDERISFATFDHMLHKMVQIVDEFPKIECII